MFRLLSTLLCLLAVGWAFSARAQDETTPHQSTEQASGLEVLDSELSGFDGEVERLLNQKRLIELQAEIATARGRLVEAERRARGGTGAEGPQRPALSVAAITVGKSGRTAVLASTSGRVRVRTGDAVAGYTVQSIGRGSVRVVDSEGELHTLGFGTAGAQASPVPAGAPVATSGPGNPVTPAVPIAEPISVGGPVDPQGTPVPSAPELAPAEQSQ